jgi:uncharacterized membrane protein
MGAELVLVMMVQSLALALRPWRGVAAGGPPWPWLAWWALMPLLWSTDRIAQVPVVQPLSGACLLMLMAGWPLAMLALAPVSLIAALVGGLDLAQAVHRLVWLGIVPATLAMLFGAGLRRWLPNHLFVYILGRGFFASALATTAAGMLAWWRTGSPAGTSTDDLLIARWLAGWGDSVLTGMLVAIFVAFRPEWLATYSDRLYLPASPPQT